MDDTDFDVADAAQELERQPTTKSGSVRKRDAMDWLKRLDEPSDEELIAAVTHKPDEFSGSTFATPVSQVRVIRSSSPPSPACSSRCSRGKAPRRASTSRFSRSRTATRAS